MQHLKDLLANLYINFSFVILGDKQLNYSKS